MRFRELKIWLRHNVAAYHDLSVCLFPCLVLVEWDTFIA